MRHFTQIHILTAYPPSNPNRDDQGRPKSAIYGLVQRLRISSQALKRAVRTSPVMCERLNGHMGTRTQQIGEQVREHLVENGAEFDAAVDIAKRLATVFGKVDEEALRGKDPKVKLRQLAFISPTEREEVFAWALRALGGEEIPDDISRRVLKHHDQAVDIAMFGRMLANDAEYNREAAVQFSHAISTHRASIEDDYVTAVDDLRRRDDGQGAAFIGDAAFGAGVFYLYTCIDNALLVDNLGGDRALASMGVAAFVEALAVSAPRGGINSYGHHGRAGYMLVEAGDIQPRSLATAFLRPVTGDDVMEGSVKAMDYTVESFDRAYGAQSAARIVMNVAGREGSMEEVSQFVAQQIDHE